MHSEFTKLLVINNMVWPGGFESFSVHPVGLFIHLNFSEADYEIFINVDTLP